MTGGKDRSLYESIGRTYASTRRADPRVAAHVVDALGDARTVLNVGAGSGNYEPDDRPVVAVEPALAMIGQRAPSAGPAVRGVAEALPVRDAAFDVALATFTLHHWRDLGAGLAELRRVARRQVVLLFDPAMTGAFWAMDYFPEALTLPTETDAPAMSALDGHLDVREVRPVPVPIDCTDGFGAAFWGRPDAYLEPEVQAGMSWLAQLPDDLRRRGTERLAADLASGEWDRRHGHLRSLAELDVGYRLVLAGG